MTINYYTAICSYLVVFLIGLSAKRKIITKTELPGIDNIRGAYISIYVQLYIISSYPID